MVNFILKKGCILTIHHDTIKWKDYSVFMISKQFQSSKIIQLITILLPITWKWNQNLLAQILWNFPNVNSFAKHS